ncbi:MAG: Na/Pi cotransporter family protein [Desulfobulbaceae bacterium]|jgi:phosphate:Na+ symporter|nr:Na/Pi cotransporter family protein [Desulfobulbaceae bacterium]
MKILFIAAQIGGGLALFLFSISMLSNTLKKIAGHRLKSLLEKAVGNPVKGALTGAAVTFLVQSSSITVLLLLGLVNAGIMNLRQAVYVILGSEIGTTITAQIVAFKVKVLFYPLLMTGFALRGLCSRESLRNAGEILFFLGLIFLSMYIMTEGSRPLRDYPAVLDLLARFGVFPLYGILIGAALTAITSSSSATTSLVIAMSMENIIDLKAGIALIIGANIGTCVLELIAAAGANTAARRTGMAQFMINVFGALLFFPFLDHFARIINLTASELPRLIANAHTVFNLTVSLVFLPFVGLIIAVLQRMIPGRKEVEPSPFGALEEKFLQVPALALYEAEEEVNRMASIAGEMLKQARKAFFDRDDDAAENVRDAENTVDAIHDRVGAYLNKISTVRLNEKDRAQKRALLHAITDIERVADLAENIAEYAREENVTFSAPARRELAVLFDRAVQVYIMAVTSLARKRKSLITDIGRMEQEIDELEVEYRKTFIRRLEEEKARPVVDALYPNVLKDIERIGDHANNIGEYVMKMK